MTGFIDVHVHPPVAGLFGGAFAPYLEGLRAFSGREFEPMSPEDLADYYRSRGGRAVLFAWDAQTASGRLPFDNEAVAGLVDAHPDVFLGFGSVDPGKGAAAIAGIHEAKRLGLRGLEFHPPAQRFSPADRRAYPLWEIAEELGLPVLLHTGFTALGAGTPGGSGIEIAYGDPMLVDRIAADFPGLTIILTHPSWPWHEQALAVTRHKPNVHLAVGGRSPRQFDADLVAAITGPLAERTMFGSGFPLVDVDEWLQDWGAIGVSEQASRQILYENARVLLGMLD